VLGFRLINCLRQPQFGFNCFFRLGLEPFIGPFDGICPDCSLAVIDLHHEHTLLKCENEVLHTVQDNYVLMQKF
jgi:hypothetical protein